MTWPERDGVTRFLGGVGGAILGAFLGFLIPAWLLRYFTMHSDASVVGWSAIGGAALGFIAGFWFGDPAVRFLMRVIGRGAA
jgi:hypothetical protein